MSLQAALELARSLASDPVISVTPVGRRPARRLVVGDPQAPLETFLEALALRGLIGPDGRLLPETQLVSVGDHFDWGRPADRARATRDGLALLAWLAAHPPDQVVILAGNHDLGRVGELVALDDEGFARAHARAAAIYGPEGVDAALEAAFLAEFPMFPTAEVAARDLSCFCVAQRALVSALLRAGRLRLGFAAHADCLVVHAGLTLQELDALGLTREERAHAPTVAAALNAALDAAARAWTGGPFAIPHLHEPGHAAVGEAGGALFHRPADPRLGRAADFEGPRRRRYDPRLLPAGLVQVVGHVRDHKCRALMPAWADEEPARDGVLRTLRTDGSRVAYGHGIAEPAPGEAALWFVDAGMNHLPTHAIPLLDLDRRAADG